MLPVFILTALCKVAYDGGYPFDDTTLNGKQKKKEVFIVRFVNLNNKEEKKKRPLQK